MGLTAPARDDGDGGPEQGQQTLAVVAGGSGRVAARGPPCGMVHRAGWRGVVCVGLDAALGGGPGGGGGRGAAGSAGPAGVAGSDLAG